MRCQLCYQQLAAAAAEAAGRNTHSFGQIWSQVSCHTSEKRVEAALVRVICADPNPVGPGVKEQELKDVFSTRFQGRPQWMHHGSFAIAEACPRKMQQMQKLGAALEGGWTLVATIWPTRPSQVRVPTLAITPIHARAPLSMCLSHPDSTRADAAILR